MWKWIVLSNCKTSAGSVNYHFGEIVALIVYAKRTYYVTFTSHKIGEFNVPDKISRLHGIYILKQ